MIPMSLSDQGDIDSKRECRLILEQVEPRRVRGSTGPLRKKSKENPGELRSAAPLPAEEGAGGHGALSKCAGDRVSLP